MEQNSVKTAVITGASSGLGREYVKAIVEHYPDINQFWLIARRYDKMNELADSFPQKDFRIIALDLSQTESFCEYQKLLEAN